MDLPPILVNEIQRGRGVLFLGAGAVADATTPDGKKAPLGAWLGELLADRFLGGEFKSSDLSMIAELSISESSLGDVQDYVADLLRDLQPSDLHRVLARFRWRGLATTNFDRVIEASYQSEEEAAQKVVPMISDRDRMDEILRDKASVALLKLHGCITRTRDPELQLILTADQYATHRKHRQRLFTTFSEWAREYPVVYLGHAMRDSDLRAVIMEISEDVEFRPRHYLVRPQVHPAEERFWSNKRIAVIAGTFEEFIAALQAAIPATRRVLMSMVDQQLPIQQRFASLEQPSSELLSSLEVDLEYVHVSMPAESADRRKFYQGFGFEWSPVMEGWDVRRSLTDKVLSDVILRSEEDRPGTVDFYVIKAEAGAGKSVLLRRLAWEAASEAGVVVLYLRKYGSLTLAPLRELARLTKERLYLFADDAADHVADLRSLIQEAKRADLRLTVITAERWNAWNVECESLDDVLDEEYRLRYLSRDEIIKLLELLEAGNSLGSYLEGKDLESRVHEFEKRAGRQLLVALHEATMGKPLEEILVNEFNEIESREAQSLYLTVCVLNRFGDGVRAGLISRVHDINFSRFRERFFEPLEHVVFTGRDPATGDYYYRARHPEIAQIVFDEILRSPADRLHMLSKIVPKLNLAYSSDLAAFRKLLRARPLTDLFPSREDVEAVFDLGEGAGANEAFLWQQKAIFERIRPDGSLGKAAEYLRKARKLEPRNRSIDHSLAELARDRALTAESPLERERYRKEAVSLLDSLFGHPQHSRFARHTLAKINIDRLKDVLDDDSSRDRTIDEAIRQVDKSLLRALQEHPEDAYLLSAEAEFSRLVLDRSRAMEALRKANDANPRDAYIASRLARVLEDAGERQESIDVLRNALEANRGDRNLNFMLARMLRKQGEADAETLAYYYRRSFSSGDSNYEAQFWYARFIYESSVQARAEAAEIFRNLRKAPIPHKAKIETRVVLEDQGRPIRFTGTIQRVEEDFGFVVRDGEGDRIFLHRSEQEEAVWRELRPNLRLSFNLGFGFAGVRAVRADLIG